MSDTRFTLNAQLSGQRLSIALPLTVAGTVNYLDVMARGNDSWDDCTVTCYLQNENGDVTRLGLQYSYDLEGYVYPSDNRYTLTAGQWSVWFSGVRSAGNVVTYRIVSEIKTFTIKANDFYSSAETNPPQLSEQAYALANTAYTLANDLDNAWKAGELTGEQGVPGVPADIGEVTATVDNNVGTPSCDVTITKDPDEENSYNMDFDFKNIKGERGYRGYKAVIDEVGVTVAQTTGVPSASATVTETQGNNNYRIDFQFSGIKGETGETGETIDDYVLVQPTQPTSLTNKIWVDSDDTPITLPTPEDFDYYDIVQNFDTTKNYNAGDYVTHEGGVYVFNINHSAGEWDSTEVTQTVLGNEVTDLKSKIDTEIGSTTGNLFNINDTNSYANYRYWNENNTLTTNASFIALNPIPVSNYEKLVVKNIGANASSSAVRSIWLDANQEMLPNGAFKTTTENMTLEVPEGAFYIKFSVKRAKRDLFSVNGITEGNIDRKLDSINYELTELGKQMLSSDTSERILVPITWDWWFSESVTDSLGNTFIGFIANDTASGAYKSYIGVMQIASDGSTLYHKLKFVHDGDDHNSAAVNLLSDGRLVVMATNGHAAADHINVYIATEPNTINCDFNDKSFDIPHPIDAETPDYYKLTYSQIFIHEDVIYDFFRVTTQHNHGSGICYVKSADLFDTFTFGAFASYDNTYCKFRQTTESGKIRACITNHANDTRNKVYEAFIDLESGQITVNGVGNVGQLTVVNPDEWLINKMGVYAPDYFRELVSGGTDFKLRLLDVAVTGPNVSALLYGKSDNYESPTFFTYVRYLDGTNTELCESGYPFYKTSNYLCGCVFGWSINDIFACVNTSTTPPGEQEKLHVLKKINAADTNNIKASDILHYYGCMIRPIYSSAGRVIVSCGKYNDISGTPEVAGNNVFKQWQLFPRIINV